MNLRRKLASIAVVTLLAVGLDTTAAEASSIYTCDDTHVCLYHWINENTGGGVWRSSIQNLYLPPHNGCLTLGTAGYDTDSTLVNGSEGSLVVNDPANDGNVHNVEFFYWANCNQAGGYFIKPFEGPGLLIIPNLQNVTSPSTGVFVHSTQGNGNNYYHHISSIGYDNAPL